MPNSSQHVFITNYTEILYMCIYKDVLMIFNYIKDSPPLNFSSTLSHLETFTEKSNSLKFYQDSYLDSRVQHLSS